MMKNDDEIYILTSEAKKNNNPCTHCNQWVTWILDLRELVV
jgi:hypothetical protein